MANKFNFIWMISWYDKRVLRRPILFGLLQLPWWGYITVLMVLTQLTILSVTFVMKDAQQQRRLARVLDNFQSLRIVYQFRLKLQAIWSRSTASQKELLDALQEWCQQAEATGIETLLQFATRLKMYVQHTMS